ncbi:MAG TPA: GNAT family N-acetyltransferase [Bauldia sp.]|nr:GNAT family N-acetyltransferase [Bauldia sp.]
MRPVKLRRDTTLVTERLKLRALRHSDLAAIVANVRDYDIAKMTTSIPHPYSDADGRAFLAAQGRTPSAISFAVEHAGTLAGICGLFAMPLKSELGYWFAKSVWGRGFATETGAALLAFGFQTLGLPTIHYRVFVDNPASQRVAAKLGFRRLGTGVSHSLARGGEVAHIHLVLTAARFRAAH